MKKRVILNLYRFLVSIFFKCLYGSIKKRLSLKEKKLIKINKIILDYKNYYIYKIYNGRIFNTTIYDCAYILNNKIIEGPSYQFRPVNSVSPLKNFVISNGTPNFLKIVNNNIFSILSGGAPKTNYWHWLFDSLPRFGLIEKIYNYKNFSNYLVPSLKYPFQIDTLKYLGIDISRCLGSDNHKHIYSNIVFATTHPYVFKDASYDIQHIPKWIILWLKKKFEHLVLYKKNYPKKIYIDRSDSVTSKMGYRTLENEEDIKKILKKKGFENIILSKLTFKDQINLFYNSKIIIGLHGSGFSNLVFCKKKTAVIEFRNKKTNKAIENLALSCSLKYSSLEHIDKKKIFLSQQGSILVDINRLEEMI